MMRCFCPSTTDVYFNLAAEEYLLKHSTENIFMLWQSDRAVVVGKNQQVESEADLRYTGEKNIRIARRFSGGGAVFQDTGNLNLTFIESADQVNFTDYLNRVTTFLSTIGIQAETDQRLGITVNGLKISGSAQCIHKSRVMYHCTLLYSTDLNILNASLNGKTDVHALLPGSPNVRAVASVRSRVTNLNREMSRPPSLRQFKEQVFHHFLHESPENTTYLPDEDTITAIKALRNDKYIRPEWIMQRSQERQTKV